ncbi:MAG: isopeptide-forming domain-containing fimbrial protein [Caldilineaceae bacterium]
MVLPFSAEYLNSTDGGIYWPEKHQAFWQLGDVPSGEGGVISVDVRFFWGLPDNLQDEAMGLLLATNIEDCPLDPAPYLSYTPRSFTGSTDLSAAQVEQDRQSYPDLETIYQDALTQGYQFVDAVEKQTNSGALIRQITLIDFDRAIVMYLLRQGSRVQASIYTPDSFGVRTATGGYVRDLASGNVDYWGSWAGATELSLAEMQVLDEGRASSTALWKTCPGWLVANKIKAIGSLLNANDCYICKNTGNPDACAKCGGTVSGLPGVGEAVDTLRCGSDCADNPDSHLCTADKRTCDQSLWNIYHLLDVPNYKVLRCLGGRYAPLPEVVTCAFGTKCVEDQGCVDCNASGADCNRTSVRIARDPNAKYGPVGELLPGQTVTYTVTYENEGGGTAFGVFVADELSEHFDPASVVLTGDGTFYPESRLISWNVGELAPKGEIGSEGAVTVTAKLKNNLPSGTVIRNQATVYFPSVPEVTPTNAVVNTIQALVADPQSLTVESGQSLAVVLTGKDAAGATVSYALVDEPIYAR